jgi:hypothetical protein
MLKRTVTSNKVASVASKVLRSERSSKAAKSVAGSALTQTKSSSKVTSAKVATVSSKVLKQAGSSKSAKTSAGSALTQKTK